MSQHLFNDHHTYIWNSSLNASLLITAKTASLYYLLVSSFVTSQHWSDQAPVVRFLCSTKLRTTVFFFVSAAKPVILVV